MDAPQDGFLQQRNAVAGVILDGKVARGRGSLHAASAARHDQLEAGERFRCGDGQEPVGKDARVHQDDLLTEELGWTRQAHEDWLASLAEAELLGSD